MTQARDEFRAALHAVHTELDGRLIRDAHQVDVKKWTLPDDVHLLKSPAQFQDQLLRGFAAGNKCAGDPMPAFKTVDRLQFRAGETTVWAGYKESFKSSFLSELLGFWACQGIFCAQASLEQPALVLLRKMVIQVLADGEPVEPQIVKAIERLAETLTLYDVTGRVRPRHMAAVMHFCGKALGCRHFVFDNLSMLQTSGSKDERAEQLLELVADAVAIGKLTGMHVHLVGHCTKPENGDESKFPTGYSVRGLGSISDMVDNQVLVWRNKPKELALDSDRLSAEKRAKWIEEPDVILEVDKQRNWAYRGRLKFWVDERTLRFREYGTSECLPFL